uniref:Uncharacterized protein n=1 Tax=Arundo donax TaxID=35708 RepID=A0A0A9EB45_ARUDO
MFYFQQCQNNKNAMNTGTSFASRICEEQLIGNLIFEKKEKMATNPGALGLLS